MFKGPLDHKRGGRYTEKIKNDNLTGLGFVGYVGIDWVLYDNSGEESVRLDEEYKS